MSEKSDPEYVPDDAEPWDNRPDAVNDALICSACGTIGNADDLAFEDEPCPRSGYEDDDCDGFMRRLTPRTYWYLVGVTTDSLEHADQVMGERLGYDEQYEDEHGVEFDYRFDRTASLSDPADAVRAANMLLSEVEIAQRADG